MNRRFFLLLPASGCLAHAWSKEFDLPAPGPVKQNAFISCPVDFSPGKKYLTEKRQGQGCPTLLRTPKGPSTPDGTAAA